MSDRARRRRMPERAAEVPESAPAPALPASPLAAFLDDAEAALSELREFESERSGNGESR